MLGLFGYTQRTDGKVSDPKCGDTGSRWALYVQTQYDDTLHL